MIDPLFLWGLTKIDQHILPTDMMVAKKLWPVVQLIWHFLSMEVEGTFNIFPFEIELGLGRLI